MVMSDEVTLVEGKLKLKYDPEEEEEHSDEEPNEDKFEPVFENWQGEEILYELFRPVKHRQSKHHDDDFDEE